MRFSIGFSVLLFGVGLGVVLALLVWGSVVCFCVLLFSHPMSPGFFAIGIFAYDTF